VTVTVRSLGYWR